MNIQHLRWWQWIALSVVLGCVAALVRSWLADATFDSKYAGTTITQEAFEYALQKRFTVKDKGEVPWLQDIVVHPDPRRPSMYVITALAPNDFYERLRSKRDKMGEVNLRQVTVLANEKYFPLVDPERAFFTVENARRDAGNQRGARNAQSEQGNAASKAEVEKKNGGRQAATTALAFMKDYTAKNPVVSFRFAWWEMPWAIWALWGGGTVLVLGGLWPPILKALVRAGYGRPEDEFSLASYKAKQVEEKVAKVGVTQADMDALKALDDEMERKLAAGAGARKTPTAPPAAADTPAVRKLAGGPVVVSEDTSTAAKNKAFGAEREDFYPTEVHGKK